MNAAAYLAFALAALAIIVLYTLSRAYLRELRSAHRAMYLIARESLDQPPAPAPIINVETPEPQIHLDMAPQPDFAALIPEAITLPGMEIDPTDGVIPEINVDWNNFVGDPTDETSYPVDPTD